MPAKPSWANTAILGWKAEAAKGNLNSVVNKLTDQRVPPLVQFVTLVSDIRHIAPSEGVRNFGELGPPKGDV